MWVLYNLSGDSRLTIGGRVDETGEVLGKHHWDDAALRAMGGEFEHTHVGRPPPAYP